MDKSETGGRFPQISEAKDRKTQPMVLVSTAEHARGLEEQTCEGGREAVEGNSPGGWGGREEKSPREQRRTTAEWKMPCAV